MTKVLDIDERGQTRPRAKLFPPDEITRFRCDECGGVTIVTKKLREEIVKQLNPEYPARTVTLDCKCGVGQFIVQARSARGPR